MDKFKFLLTNSVFTAQPVKLAFRIDLSPKARGRFNTIGVELAKGIYRKTRKRHRLRIGRLFRG